MRDDKLVDVKHKYKRWMIDGTLYNIISWQGIHRTSSSNLICGHTLLYIGILKFYLNIPEERIYRQAQASIEFL